MLQRALNPVTVSMRSSTMEPLLSVSNLVGENICSSLLLWEVVQIINKRDATLGVCKESSKILQIKVQNRWTRPEFRFEYNTRNCLFCMSGSSEVLL